jgi:hypothetical protein
MGIMNISLTLSILVSVITMLKAEDQAVSLQYIRDELAKNEDLKPEEIKKYIRSIAPAYVLHKGDRSIDSMTLDSVKEDRFEFHRYLVHSKFHNVLDPDLPSLTLSLLGFSFVAAVVCFMILCSHFKTLLLKRVKANISKRISEISKDLIVLFVAVAVLKIVDYFRLIPVKFAVVLLNDIQLLLSMFSVMYVIVNIATIVKAQASISEWVEYEEYIPDRVEVYRDFERLYIENLDGMLDRESKPKYDKLKRVMKFISLRQEFLTPTFVPLLKESVLRDDFTFSDYLGKAFYKTLRDIVSLRRFSLISFLIMFMLYTCLRLVFHEAAEVFVMAFLGLLFYLIMYVLQKASQNIFYRLSRPLHSPYEFTVQPFDAVRNPYSNMDKILTPYYLRNNLEQSFASQTRLISAHESLFLYSSPGFCLRMLHLTIFGQIIWLVIFCTNYPYALDTWFKLIVSVFVLGLSIYSMVNTFPYVCRNFALITNIEMMKDDLLVQEVIHEQKVRTSRAFVRLFRVTKLLRKDIPAEDEGSAQDHKSTSMHDQGMINLVIVASRLAYTKLKNEQGLRPEDLKKFCRLIGSIEISEQELRILQARCAGGAPGAPISFYTLMDAIDEIGVEASLSPAAASYRVLARQFPNKESIAIKEMEFFLKGVDNLSQEDADLILAEIRYLQSVKSSTSPEDIALLIRDSSERHAK